MNSPHSKSLVLAVASEAEIKHSVRQALSQESRVAFAADGDSGVTKAMKLRPDLLLIDMTSPEETEQVVQHARGCPELENTPIVVLSAVADAEVNLRLLRDGAQDYLMKPFALELLRVRVNSWLMLNHTREVLQSELESKSADVEGLARALAKQARETRTAMASLRQARETAERANKMKNALIGMISHELRTPVTGLQLQLERLQRGRESPLSAKQRELIRRMSVSSRWLADLIDSLLQYARIQTGRRSIHLEPCDAGSIATAAIEDVRLQAAQKKLGMRVAIPPDLPMLNSDPRLLRLILVNLLINAVKFTDRGFIELEIDRAQNALRLRIRDTGPGIAPENRSRVFESFEQLDPAMKKLPGVGLGLALVREMAASLGGEILLESELGSGSTFTVLLPSAADPEKLARVS